MSTEQPFWSRNVETRERLLRDWMVRYLHDLGHSIRHVAILFQTETEARSAKSGQGLKEAIDHLSKFRFDGALVMNELHGIGLPPRARYADKFVFDQIVHESLSLVRTEFERASVQLVEDYKPPAPVRGCEADVRFAIEGLLDVMLSSYRGDREEKQAGPGRKVTVRVGPKRTDGVDWAELFLQGLGGTPICNRTTDSRSGRSTSAATWQNATFGRLALLLAHQVFESIGGTVRIMPDAQRVNTIIVGVPAVGVPPGERRHA